MVSWPRNVGLRSEAMHDRRIAEIEKALIAGEATMGHWKEAPWTRGVNIVYRNLG